MAKKTKEEWKVQKNVFSLSSERNLFKFASQGFFEHIESPIRTGKESNVFSAIKKDNSRIIIKIYRMENCNFNKMYEYIRPDPRYLGVKKGKRNILFSWVQREYRNLLKAREVIRVPTPLAYRDNILLMEFIGEDSPSPILKHLIPETVSRQKAIFRMVIGNIEKLLCAGLVHGDLSEYNILNYAGSPVFIDFSQCTLTSNPNSKQLLERDVAIVCTFFSRMFSVDEKAELSRIMKSWPKL